jgi:galactose mutarotase-like enzyme
MRCERGKRGAFETWTLRDVASRALLELAPARGGLVTRLQLRGEEILFLDEATFHDTGKSVRGGIPILFPIAGKLGTSDAQFSGRPIHLPQHGFARNLAWDVVDETDRLAIALRASEATRPGFPFEFEARVSYRLQGDSLSVEAQITNRDSVAMPVHLGFHPYLWVPAAAKGASAIEAAATRAFDNRTGAEVAYAPPALGGDEVDLHLWDPRGGAVRLRAPGRPTVRLDYGGFPVVVVWTLPGRDFVCVEPWSAPGGALASGRGLRSLDPGESDCRMWFLQAEP